ncbi:M48 family metalloprotease [Streptomyces sp. NPDC006314]|uniref:M48 family metalloprotease n=1 Tax=Streptomyces sp. NPDC006314 TaxID=3154475 RepID=UPI0033B1F2F7
MVDPPRPDAHALPGRPHRIVVTTAMLHSLDGPEREAFFAHERAHNEGGHHYVLAAAELAAAELAATATPHCARSARRCPAPPTRPPRPRPATAA